jgi:hypothetical protein
VDKPTEKLITDLLGLLLILAISVLAYMAYGDPGILVGGGLALTVWAASIALFRKG